MFLYHLDTVVCKQTGVVIDNLALLDIHLLKCKFLVLYACLSMFNGVIRNLYLATASALYIVHCYKTM